jgi:hypothetical protein
MPTARCARNDVALQDQMTKLGLMVLPVPRKTRLAANTPDILRLTTQTPARAGHQAFAPSYDSYRFAP